MDPNTINNLRTGLKVYNFGVTAYRAAQQTGKMAKYIRKSYSRGSGGRAAKRRSTALVPWRGSRPSYKRLPMTFYRNPRMNYRQGGFIGKESKFIDTTLINSNITDSHVWENHSGTNGSLIGCVQGDGASQRDGRIYFVSSINVRGYIQQDKLENATNPLPDVQTTLILYLDKMCNGAEPSVTDIIVNGSRGNLDFRNLEYSTRYDVLRRVEINQLAHMTSGTVVNDFSMGTKITPFRMNYKFNPPLKVNTDGTTADVANLTNYNIGIQACSTNGHATDGTEVNYVSRVRFYSC